MDIFAIPKIKARTTGRIGKGQPGRFWQRPGLVGSGKENEVGRPCMPDRSQKTEPEYTVSFY